MFLGGSKNLKIGSNVNTEKVCADTTSIGNLVVPSMGVGTISWSSKSCKLCHEEYGYEWKWIRF